MRTHPEVIVRVSADSLSSLQSFKAGVIGLLILLMSTACATVAPKEEVRALQRAFITVQEASQPLFDDLASAERRQGQVNAAIKAKKGGYSGECSGISWAGPGFIEGYCLADAAYFSQIGDPPATAGIRRGIRIVGDYVDVLLFLAEGKNLDDTTAQVRGLSQNVAGLMTLIPSAGPAGAVLMGATGALDPIFRNAAQAKNTEELKRLVLAGAPHIKSLIGALRLAAPECFNTLIQQSVIGATSPEALDTPAIAQVHMQRIAAYRIVISDYVMLLSELEKAFDELVYACQHPPNGLSLAIAAQRSGELVTYAESWRKVYMHLRMGGSQ
jgi:hypothetical protein